MDGCFGRTFLLHGQRRRNIRLLRSRICRAPSHFADNGAVGQTEALGSKDEGGRATGESAEQGPVPNLVLVGLSACERGSVTRPRALRERDMTA